MVSLSAQHPHSNPSWPFLSGDPITCDRGSGATSQRLMLSPGYRATRPSPASFLLSGSPPPPYWLSTSSFLFIQSLFTPPSCLWVGKGSAHLNLLLP